TDIVSLWREANLPMLEGKVNLDEKNLQDLDARLMMWDHYVHVSGYPFAYAIGWAAAPKLMEECEKDPPAFIQKFKEVSARANDMGPVEFLLEFGIDIREPQVWNDRLAQMERDVAALGTLLKEQKRDAALTQGGKVLEDLGAVRDDVKQARNAEAEKDRPPRPV
ncbi:MAG: hypothetical protein EB060_09640, partial [Proteobacteria bacterium]|nr:hypothetical protein [Pseudomonadota bacterium]